MSDNNAIVFIVLHDMRLYPFGYNRICKYYFGSDIKTDKLTTDILEEMHRHPDIYDDVCMSMLDGLIW